MNKPPFKMPNRYIYNFLVWLRDTIIILQYRVEWGGQDIELKKSKKKKERSD